MKFKIGDCIIGNLGWGQKDLDIIIVGSGHYVNNGLCYEFVVVNNNDNLFNMLDSLLITNSYLSCKKFYDYQPVDAIDDKFKLKDHDYKKDNALFYHKFVLKQKIEEKEKLEKEINKTKKVITNIESLKDQGLEVIINKTKDN